MLTKNSICIFIYFAFTLTVYAQNKHTLVSIDNDNFSVEEFDFIYQKNNDLSENPKSKKEYIDLFVNYKLKVKAAEDKGLDTLPSFLKEYNYYKEELSKPYLTDKSITENLKHEAYERLTKEIKASHILVLVKKDATPEDTLKAYKRIENIRNRIIAGEDFNKLAFQYSEDPSAKKNQGELGYFTGFMMVYPFESAAFKTPVGEVSDIVRTQFGYHIIKVEDIRDNRGELRTAHIMKIIPQNSTEDKIESLKNQIDSIYQLLQEGAKFDDLARKYSDDKSSAVKGGELPWFGSKRMIPEFSDPAFKLDTIGQISNVIRTPYGFHIIRLLEKRGIQSYEEMQDEITKNISRDERANKGREAVINRIKKEGNYTENKATVKAILNNAKTKNQTTEHFYASSKENDSIIFSLKGNNYLAKNFITDLQQDKKLRNPVSENQVQILLNTWIEDKLIEQEKSDLSEKYPDFKFLLQEYYDGLLIFEISQQEIWNKASNDSIGIKNYYEQNKEKYFFPEQLTGKAIFAKKKETYNKLNQLLQADPQVSNDSLYAVLGENEIKIIDGTIAKGDYKQIDENYWKEKDSKGLIFDEYPFVLVKGIEEPKKQKEFIQTKGQVIADYQEELEKQWINVLKTKHNITVNKKALKYSKAD